MRLVGLVGLGLLIFGSIAISARPPSGPHYAVLDRIPAADGGYDYVSMDAETGLVFVGRDDGIMAVDPMRRKVMPRFAPGKGVAAVTLIPGTAWILATNSEADNATLVDRKTGEITATIATGREPDGAVYDSQAKLAFVMNGQSEDITIIDVDGAKAVGTVKVGGKPEAAVVDGLGKLYVNIEDSAEIAVVDIAEKAVVGRYQLRSCIEPTGLALDRSSGLLIAACHNGIAKLIDVGTGRDRGSFPIGKLADGIIFDSSRRLAYISCKDGTLTIAALDDQGKVASRSVIKTARGARTLALDPTTGKIYLPASDYTTNAQGNVEAIPGTFALVVVGPL